MSAAASSGQKVALIEREHVGGTCVNDGCTPSKTMVASARVAYLARRAADYGVYTGPVRVDMAQVRARKAEVVTSFRDGSRKSYEEQENLEVIWGEARFTGQKTLSVAPRGGRSRTLEVETVVINVGQRPSVPPLDGLKNVPLLTSTSVMELEEVPKHLLILGGGYVGLEFAQLFRRFGSEVTLVQRGTQLLPREDRDVAGAVTDILREDGITVLLETAAERGSGENGVTLNLKGGASVSSSHLLVATGRTPNSDSPNLGAAGIETDKKGYIKTDDRLETSAPGVYALGDGKDGPAFIHISYDDFRVAKTNLLDGGSATIAGRLVPYFIDPKLGRVCLSEAGETRGLVKVIIDAETDKLLGAAIPVLEGGELMSALQIAMVDELPHTALRDAPFAYPTLSESLNNLFGALK